MNPEQKIENQTPRDWRRPVMWALVGVNLLLGGAFAQRMVKPNTAAAQAGGGRQGDYLMCPGEVNGGVTAIVYVLDQTNHLLGAMTYDDSRTALNTMKARDIDHDFDANPRHGGR
jgi:hypothetical protein